MAAAAVARSLSPITDRPLSILGADEAAGTSGLVVSLLSIFDTNGSHRLSRREFTEGALALGFDSSEDAWESLRARFGSAHQGGPEISDPSLNLELVRPPPASPHPRAGSGGVTN